MGEGRWHPPHPVRVPVIRSLGHCSLWVSLTATLAPSCSLDSAGCTQAHVHPVQVSLSRDVRVLHVITSVFLVGLFGFCVERGESSQCP